MTFMKKEVVAEEAERYGIDIDGLSWAEQNKLVREALEADGKRVNKAGEVEEDAALRERDEKIARLEAELAELEEMRRKMQPGGVDAEPMPIFEDSPLPKGRVLLAPEIRATGVQLLKYDEVLGDDVTVEEVSYKDAMYKGAHVEKDLNLGTYRIKGKTGRKVIAQSTVPKENAGVSYDPNTDLVPVVTYGGRRGYIWTHQHYPNVKELLKACKKYQDYKHLFNASEHPENIWYAAGKMLVADIDVVESVFREIEAGYEGKR